MSGEYDIRTLSLAMRRFVSGTDRWRRLLAAELGIGTTDLAALGFLRVQGPMTPRALSDELAMTTGAITALMDRICGVGYARRVPNPSDRRSLTIELTPEGVDAMQWVYESGETSISNAVDGLLARGAIEVGEVMRFATVLEVAGDSIQNAPVSRRR